MERIEHYMTAAAADAASFVSGNVDATLETIFERLDNDGDGMISTEMVVIWIVSWFCDKCDIFCQ